MKVTATAESISVRHHRPVAGFRLLGSKKVVSLRGNPSERLTVGRTSQRTIRVRGRSVSRLHAFIDTNSTGQYMISDAGSKNGLYLAERGRWDKFRRVEWHILEVGNCLRFGNAILVVVDTKGECPITAISAEQLAKFGIEVYGSKNKVRELFNIAPRLLDRVIQAMKGKTRQ